MNSKTICFVSALFYPHSGGVERYTYQLSKKLVDMGHKVIVLTTNTENVQSCEIMDGIIIYRLPIFSKLGSRYPVLKPNSDYFALLKTIKAESFDCFVINTRFYLTTLLGLNLARKKNIPAIIIEHGTGHFTINNKVFDFMGRIYENGITKRVKSYHPKFYGVSQACNTWLKQLGIEASGVLYNGVDANYPIKLGTNFKEKFNIPEKGMVVTYAGRLIKEKGAFEFLVAANHIACKNSGIYFFIAGNGPLLSDLMKKNSSPGNIFILGSLDYDNIMSLLYQSDVLVNPSKYPEGLPTIILEAGINKCAVIATPQGGTTEIIINDDHGIMIRTGNSKDIVDSIIRLNENPHHLNLLANNIHEKIKKEFDWNVLAINFLKKLSA
ncbi:MAG: glycosyltransferase family 4 protein [Chitinophagaceae bacterium]